MGTHGRKGLILLLVLSIHHPCTKAAAESVPIGLLELIDRSDLIVIATPFRLERKSGGGIRSVGPIPGGIASFEVQEVLKGTHDRQPIEIDDKRIDNFDTCLLFLQKDKQNRFLGIHSDGSYWPLKRPFPKIGGDCSLGTPCSYLTYAVLTDSILKPQKMNIFVGELPYDENPVRIKVFCLEDLKVLIDERKRKTE